LLLGVIIPIGIFGELAEEIWEKENGFPWDVPILLAIHATAHPQLDTLAIVFTHLGTYWGVFPISFAIATVLFIQRLWYRLTYFLVVLLGSAVINRSAKLVLRRIRPDLWVSPAPELDYGFPSGHAMASMTFVVALIILTWHYRWRGWVWILGILFVLMIGWTRLYLGVHYPSDILAGWSASIAWSVGVHLIMRRTTKFTGSEPK
jgi:undecaprenyl-diphosphatase